jgi:hypothetical protein
MSCVVAISATVTQHGRGVDSGRGSVAPMAVRAKTFGISTGFLLATTTDRSGRMAVEPSMPLAQNAFAMQRVRASTIAMQADWSRNNVGHFAPTVKIASQ